LSSNTESTCARSPGDTPDWSGAFVGEASCPLCDYNLRGLVEPRCPECGYRFEWSELLDAARRPPAYLFEHARRRRVRAFLWTQAVGWLPRRFWGRVLRPTHDVMTDRLAQYWWWSAAMFAIGPLLTIIIPSFLLANENNPSIVSAMRGLSGFIAVWLSRHGGFALAVGAALVLWIAWPFLTIGSLLIFTDSMRRANVRREHVGRCVLYSCDAGLIAGVVAPSLYFLLGIDHHAVLGAPTEIIVILSMLFCVFVAFRLAHAYALYLRFPHAVMTVVLSQVVVLLIGWLFAAVVWEMTDAPF
jgi:hypothetical protein